MTKEYIKWGEKQPVKIRGRKEPVIGYNKVPSVSGRSCWYSLNELEPANFLLPMYIMDRFFVSYSTEPVICDHTLYALYPKTAGAITYLNSTVFYITMELHLRRLGGGVGEVMVDDYEQMPVADFSKLREVILERRVFRYFEEVKMSDRKQLDDLVLSTLDLENIDLEELYSVFVELVEDRLVKADRPLRINDTQDSSRGTSDD